MTRIFRSITNDNDVKAKPMKRAKFRRRNKSNQAILSNDIRTDVVTIDHRISDAVEIYNADEIIVDGGDNVFQIGSLQPVVDTIVVGTPVQVVQSRFNVGTINENITFAKASTLRGGAGNDTFNIEAHGVRGSFYGGGGDDLFRFAGETDSATEPLFGSSIQAHGNAGNDRFIYLPGIKMAIETFGGTGDDVADFRHSKQASYVYFQRASDSNSNSPALEIEKFSGAEGYDNNIRLRSQAVGERFDWIIDGSSTTIRSAFYGQSVQVENFNRFHAGSNAIDNFFLLSTSDDIEIIDGDNIQISSELEPSTGNLDGITHDISIVRLGDYIQPLPPGVFSFAANLRRDVDGTTASPVVSINNMAGDVVIATFGADKEIRGIAGGVIRFVDDQQSLSTILIDAEELTPFQPNLTVHGSATENDVFLIKETWTPTTVFSHGGDDTFMIGSTNRAADGDLLAIAGDLSIGAGRGVDRVYVNNQSFDTETANYVLSGSQLSASRVATANPFASINFNSAVEVVRISGSRSQTNEFRIAARGRQPLLSWAVRKATARTR